MVALIIIYIVGICSVYYLFGYYIYCLLKILDADDILFDLFQRNFPCFIELLYKVG
jgi:hypothetical protein